MVRYSDEELLNIIEECENKYGKVSEKLINNDSDFCHSSTISSRFGTFSNAKLKSDIENVGQIHLTDTEREKINNSITERQKNIMKGILMGDAWICKEENKTPYLAIENTNKEFMFWLEDELKSLCSDLRIRNTAKESANKNKQYGYTVNEENYNDIWVFETRSLKYFNKLREWYDTGQKRIPENLELEPIILKLWYCCDGSLAKNKYPVIYSSNENDRKSDILDIFEEINMEPSFTDGGGGCINFKNSGAEDFFNYIGKPLPGFEYKWLDNY